jgi:acetolactate synthase I/II/III large subunit
MPDKKVDLHVKENVSFVLDELLDKIRKINPVDSKWIDYCKDKRKKYPLIEDTHKSENYVNSYDFMNKLSCHLKDDHIIVTDMGTALLSGHQNLKLKSNQKMFTSLGLGEMGYGIAGSIGAAAACPDKEVLCLNCDGGIMMNLQELHTVVENGLNIKVVIFNNDGYLMIKHTQKMLFKGHHCSVDKKTGIGLPDFSKLLPAFGYEYFSLRDKDDIDQKIKIFLECNSNAVLEVFMDPVQLFSPKVTAQVKNDGLIISTPIEDMSPLLNFQTLENDMIIKLSKNSLEINR